MPLATTTIAPSEPNQSAIQQYGFTTVTSNRCRVISSYILATRESFTASHKKKTRKFDGNLGFIHGPRAASVGLSAPTALHAGTLLYFLEPSLHRLKAGPRNKGEQVQPQG